MHSTSLNKLYDFIQVQYEEALHQYFSKHILFITIYLLQKMKCICKVGMFRCL
jgi:hypothetical protein